MGISTKKFAREVLAGSIADEMEVIRNNSHMVCEFRKKGMTKGYRYVLPVSVSCHHAKKNAIKDINRGITNLEKEMIAA